MAGSAHNLIGDNMRRLRLARNLGQAELAGRAGLSRTAIQKIEKGDSSPRVETLGRIAEALDVEILDLMRQAPRLTAVRFRSKKRMKSREDILVKIARMLHDFKQLEDVLSDRKEYKLKGLAEKIQRLPLKGKERAEKAAEMAREKLGLEPDEVILDVSGGLESAGIKVCPISVAADDFFGLSVLDEEFGPAIVVNVWERITVERWIFSAAHELGHLLMHTNSFNDEDSEYPMREEEDEANIFASYFLMPQEAFEGYWQATRGLGLVQRVMKVKRIFLVSYQTVLMRLMDRGIADKSIWPKFYHFYKLQYNRSLSRKEEPDGIQPEEVGSFAEDMVAAREPHRLDPSDFVVARLKDLTRTALEEEKIGMSKAAEILGMDLQSTRDWAASWGNVDVGHENNASENSRLHPRRKRSA